MPISFFKPDPVFAAGDGRPRRDLEWLGRQGKYDLGDSWAFAALMGRGGWLLVVTPRWQGTEFNNISVGFIVIFIHKFKIF
jgi:hypothetical protein